MNRFLTPVFSIILLLLFTGTAFAVAIGESQIIVNSLTITGGEFSEDWAYDGLGSHGEINSPSGSAGYDEVTNDTSQYDLDRPFIELDTTLSHQSSYLSGDSSYFSVQAISESSGDSDLNGWINGSYGRGLKISIPQDTTLTFSLDYAITNSISRHVTDGSEDASMFSQINFGLYHDVNFEQIGGELTNTTFNFPDNITLNSEDTQEGTLTFQYTLLYDPPGEHYKYDNSYWLDTHLYTTVSSRSSYIYEEPNGTKPVPEPSTFLFLGCGLIGIAVMKRKRMNK